MGFSETQDHSRDTVQQEQDSDTTGDDQHDTTGDDQPDTTGDDQHDTTQEKEPDTTGDDQQDTTGDDQPDTTGDDQPDTTGDDQPDTTRSSESQTVQDASSCMVQYGENSSRKPQDVSRHCNEYRLDLGWQEQMHMGGEDEEEQYDFRQTSFEDQGASYDEAEMLFEKEQGSGGSGKEDLWYQVDENNVSGTMDESWCGVLV
jgi:hypothetical protein